MDAKDDEAGGGGVGLWGDTRSCFNGKVKVLLRYNIQDTDFTVCDTFMDNVSSFPI